MNSKVYVKEFLKNLLNDLCLCSYVRTKLRKYCDQLEADVLPHLEINLL